MPTPAYQPPLLRRALPSCLTLAALLCLTGCFTFETLIKVRHDGSGTVEQTFVLGGPMLQMMMMFAGDEEKMDLCKEEDLRNQAAEMGAGVSLDGAETIEEEGRLGCRARYLVKDINTLRISQDPGDRLPDQMSEGAGASDAPPEFITFRFTPGATATLMVQIPQNFKDQIDQDTPDDPFPADTSQRAMQLQMMREMLKGGRVRIALAVDGAIQETNATYRKGSQVTLVDVNFDTLLEDEAQLERLMDANPKSADDVKALIENVEGIDVETQENVKIRFN